jgi:hypothetical protein
MLLGVNDDSMALSNGMLYERFNERDWKLPSADFLKWVKTNIDSNYPVISGECTFRTWCVSCLNDFIHNCFILFHSLARCLSWKDARI